MFQMRNVPQTECLTGLSLTCLRLSERGVQYLSAVCDNTWEIPRLWCHEALVTLNSKVLNTNKENILVSF